MRDADDRDLNRAPPRPTGSRRAQRLRGDGADAAIRVAAARPARRARGVGQAREPHADGRVQGARRPQPPRAARGARPAAGRAHQRDARQSRSEHRLRLPPAWHALRHRRAVRKFDRQERGDARLRRGAGRIRPRLRRSPRARAGPRGRGTPPLRGAVRTGARRRRRHVCARAFPRGPRARHRLRADRLRLGDLRFDQRTQRPRACDPHRRRRLDHAPTATRSPSRRDGRSRRRPRTRLPTAWRYACRSPRRSR